MTRNNALHPFLIAKKKKEEEEKKEKGSINAVVETNVEASRKQAEEFAALPLRELISVQFEGGSSEIICRLDGGADYNAISRETLHPLDLHSAKEKLELAFANRRRQPIC